MEEVDSSITLIKSMKRIMQSIKRSMDQEFKDINMTGPQGMLIGILLHFNKMKISELSEKLQLSNSTVSGIIDRLENQGLVERTRSKEDRRVVYVNVTPEFKKNAENHFKKIEAKYEELMKEATPEEVESIRKGLRTLENVLERQKLIRSECDDV
ncbi:MarR family transcriptional regulator [Clostridium sp. 19966]|uniref:MarR family winged helix-turn-helix transcriptional regulator n=1 Tax=Clostridium sp. 19966 TaxID=2768166 RepID=UPI0028DF06D0|nr:MarR family transcriptional regulator [Clostridium sp. 19966]MDT8717781.1 MarR family transcriptional regulator [Clostridium sp. 19966]